MTETPRHPSPAKRIAAELDAVKAELARLREENLALSQRLQAQTAQRQQAAPPPVPVALQQSQASVNYGPADIEDQVMADPRVQRALRDAATVQQFNQVRAQVTAEIASRSSRPRNARPDPAGRAEMWRCRDGSVLMSGRPGAPDTMPVQRSVVRWEVPELGSEPV